MDKLSHVYAISGSVKNWLRRYASQHRQTISKLDVVFAAFTHTLRHPEVSFSKMNPITKPLTQVLLSTRYSYQFTHIHPTDLIEQDCWICLRPYFTQEDDSLNSSDPTPKCLPIKLPCSHVVGQQCFENYRRATNEVERCLMCREKLLPLPPRTKPAALLRRICQTPWFQWHDCRLGWALVEASSSETKMYNGQVLT